MKGFFGSSSFDLFLLPPLEIAPFVFCSSLPKNPNKPTAVVLTDDEVECLDGVVKACVTVRMIIARTMFRSRNMISVCRPEE